MAHRLKYIIAAAGLLLGAEILCIAAPESRPSCQDDSTAIAGTGLEALKTKLGEYLDAIKIEPVEIQNRETDFLIESCRDSLVRQTVAVDIFRHYMNSGIMGLEAVAIHVFDRWFSNGSIRMKSADEEMAARIFCDFNRSSLIGMKAPELKLEDISGNPEILFPSDTSSAGDTDDTGTDGSNADSSKAKVSDGRWKILFFYDTGCPKCRMESIMLRNILDNGNYPVDLYAIYTQDNRQLWTDYSAENFSITAPQTKVFNLWDPDLDPDMLIRYGIIQTPRIFLVDPDGIIRGRGLDSMALEELLKKVLTPRSLEYGSNESYSFYESVFSPDGSGMDCDGIKAVIDHIADRTLSQAKDTLLFKQMAGDLLYYFPLKRGGQMKCATGYLLEKYITGRNDIWNTPDDSLKVLGFAELTHMLLSRAAIGTKVPGISVLATLKKSSGKEKTRMYRLDRLPRRTIVIFHTEGCEFCRAEIAAADSLLQEMKGRRDRTDFLLVDMDVISSSYPGTAKELLDSFDLTVLPYIFEIDSKGTVTDRYMSLLEPERDKSPETGHSGR